MRSPSAMRLMPPLAVNAQLTFTLDDNGEVDGLVLHQGGQSRPAEKISG